MDDHETLDEILTEIGWRIEGMYDSAGVFSPSEVRELSKRIKAANRRSVATVAQTCISKLAAIKLDVDDCDRGRLTPTAAMTDIGQTCDLALKEFGKLVAKETP